MTLATLGIDTYQLTTLVAHADAERIDHRVSMAFFFRRMPKQRNYVVACGLRHALSHAAQIAFGDPEIATLLAHPLLGPALDTRPALLNALRAIRGFDGEIDAVPEGTLLFSGPGVKADGSPLLVRGAPLTLYTPMIRIRTDMIRAKIVETPWLGYLNHLSMVASKAARVVDAARGKPVIEFGARRTHPAAAIDSTYAAYLAGCASTSNIAALQRFGIPSSGTMDHFAVQASERPGRPACEAEASFFATFYAAFPGAALMLVDTYDTEAGIREAVKATNGKLGGVRIDSNVTRETLARARKVLDETGAPDAKIFVSDGLDEWRVRDLVDHADGFGVGECISCSPDASTGIGAVAKLVVNGYGKVTMKLSKGSGKATLPGELQAYRFADHDRITLASEPPPEGGRPLLEPVWRGTRPVRELADIATTRAYVRAQIEALPAPIRALEPAPSGWKLVASDALVAEIERVQNEGCL
jgi:nicotinate phosphoribosyltransferase